MPKLSKIGAFLYEQNNIPIDDAMFETHPTTVSVKLKFQTKLEQGHVLRAHVFAATHRMYFDDRLEVAKVAKRNIDNYTATPGRKYGVLNSYIKILQRQTENGIARANGP